MQRAAELHQAEAKVNAPGHQRGGLVFTAKGDIVKQQMAGIGKIVLHFAERQLVITAGADLAANPSRAPLGLQQHVDSDQGQQQNEQQGKQNFSEKLHHNHPYEYRVMACYA